jgi:nitrogen regulatory protein P-II 1
MKNVVIIIQPGRFDNLRKKLIDAGVCGMTVSNVEGFGYQKKQMKLQKKDELTVELAPKIRIEIVLKDDEVEPVIQAAMEEVRTGRLGDGKIFISDLSDVIRIRTGERKDDAL